jgi:uncharacterized SAM-binding protein YcdF (DUF218 family)
MIIFLSKFLPIFIYPVGMACLLLLLAFVFYKKRRLRLWLLIAAFAVIWIGGNRWVSMSLARSLEWQYPPLSAGTKADVIVVLGGGTEPAEPPRQNVEVNGAGDRVIYAYQLYKQGVAPVLLLSGGDIDFLDTSSGTPADDMATLLTQFGVPKDALWLDRTSQNTYENAVNCAAILKQHRVKSVILVTSAMHMPRAMAMFKAQGVDAIPAPADYGVTYAGWDSLVHGNVLDQIINLFPSAGSLSLTTNALKEYMGIGYYALRGY